MSKKFILILTILALALSLLGCGNSCEHQWQDASCTAPKTCSLCGKIEGKALPHHMESATCAKLATCSLCGYTEGELADHAQLSEANFQHGPTCTLCGAEVGEPLQADFEKYNLAITAKVGEAVPFINPCAKTDDLTHGELTITEYRIIDPAVDTDIVREVKNVENGFELTAKEGYEWRLVRAQFSFKDANAWEKGIYSTGSCHEDYYDIHLHDDTDVEYDNYNTYDINWNGEIYPCVRIYHYFPWTSNKYEKSKSFEFIALSQVPIGYDGTVMGWMSGDYEWPDGKYIYDVTGTTICFFRLDNESLQDVI